MVDDFFIAPDQTASKRKSSWYLELQQQYISLLKSQKDKLELQNDQLKRVRDEMERREEILTAVSLIAEDLLLCKDWQQ